MDWSTIPVELLERIFIVAKSPQTVAFASVVCKNWAEVDRDQHLWQHICLSLSDNRYSNVSDIDWKKKALDLVVVRKNIELGRCVVRTLATTQGIKSRVTLETENPGLYKDYFLCNWLEAQNFGSYGGVVRTKANVINMVNEEVITWQCQNILFMNGYIAQTPSNYYGGAIYTEIKARKFNPKNEPFLTDSGVNFNLPSKSRSLLRNFHVDSNYIGFTTSPYNSPSSIVVVNAESGQVAFSWTGKVSEKDIRLYDTFLAMPQDKNAIGIVDVKTAKTVSTREITEKFELGFMTHNTLTIRTEKEVILWNFIENTDLVYPAGQMLLTGDLEMIYHGMWLVSKDRMLSFYDVTDGSLVNTLALRDSRYERISLLSDGRLGIVQSTGCRVISFVNSEVSRKVKVDFMDVSGKVTSHEISAHELAKFFVNHVKKPYEMIISRVVSYPTKTRQNDERFVILFSQDEKNKSQPVNETASMLFRSAVQPSCLNTPYQGWKFDNKPIQVNDYIVDRVCGSVIIVREKKIDGRWQLVSM